MPRNEDSFESYLGKQRFSANSSKKATGMSGLLPVLVGTITSHRNASIAPVSIEVKVPDFTGNPLNDGTF